MRDFYPFILMGDSFFDLWRTNCPFEYVTNLAVSGSRIEHQLAYIQKSYSIDHEGLILNVGTNNLGKGDSIASTISTYSDFLDYALTVFDRIYCVSVLPINTVLYTAYWGADEKHVANKSNLKVPDFNIALKALCTSKHVSYLDIVSTMSHDNEMVAIYTNDGIHPNTDGYVVMKDIFKSATDRLIV